MRIQRDYRADYGFFDSWLYPSRFFDIFLAGLVPVFAAIIGTNVMRKNGKRSVMQELMAMGNGKLG